MTSRHKAKHNTTQTHKSAASKQKDTKAANQMAEAVDPQHVQLSTNQSPQRDHPSSNVPAPAGGDMWGNPLGFDNVPQPM